ncbi:MAG: uracil-DNA glycosylase [Candidatus Kaelpia imicola]|nr:uracil-DNA glycosylase [Candidatus Kaelpia imicola]
MINLNSLNEILETVGTCEKCGLYKFRDKVVFAEGEKNAKVMLIGLSPGERENSTGKLFIGPAGDFLNELLQSAKLNRGAFYITNIIKCHASTYAIGQKEVDACVIYLDKQIEIIKPEVIIPLDSIAAQYILKKYDLPNKRISEIHGQLLRVSIGDLFDTGRNIKIIPMFHPAAALRTPGLLELVKKDWQNLNFKEK